MTGKQQANALEVYYEEETKQKMALELLETRGASTVQESAALLDIPASTLVHKEVCSWMPRN
jgi:hypothetical protein